MRHKLNKIVLSLQTLLLVASVALLGVLNTPVSAAVLSSRLVLISSSLPSAVTTHAFSFDIITAGPLGSIDFEYCTNNPFVGTACTAPVGMDLTGASLVGESGETGFIVDPINTTANRLVITRPVTPASPQTSTYTVDGVVNPSMAKQTVYVRISTFASMDGTGPRTDAGAVALSTSGSLNIGGYVPPFLTLCVGITVSLDCSATAGSLVIIGELSTTAPRSGTSQFSAATNDPGGYAAYIIGTTLTSGNNTIPALTTPTASNAGTGQFGINLRDNSAPNTGQDPAGVGTGTPSAGYNTANQYKFVSGNQIAASPITTNFNLYTVSYIVNISAAQPPGIYNATLTYLATAAF